MPVIQAEDLHPFAIDLVAAMGGSAEEAETVADVLVRSNLAGHDSHGVIRLEQYARLVSEGAEPSAQRPGDNAALRLSTSKSGA